MTQHWKLFPLYNLIINVKVWLHGIILMVVDSLHRKTKPKYSKIHFPMRAFMIQKWFYCGQLKIWFVLVIHDVGDLLIHYSPSYASFCFWFLRVLWYFVVFVWFLVFCDLRWEYLIICKYWIIDLKFSIQ